MQSSIIALFGAGISELVVSVALNPHVGQKMEDALKDVADWVRSHFGRN